MALSYRCIALQVYTFQCNVRKEDEIQALAAFALEKMGRIDGLVNNAGGASRAPDCMIT